MNVKRAKERKKIRNKKIRLKRIVNSHVHETIIDEYDYLEMNNNNNNNNNEILRYNKRNILFNSVW